MANVRLVYHDAWRENGVKWISIRTHHHDGAQLVADGTHALAVRGDASRQLQGGREVTFIKDRGDFPCVKTKNIWS